ncbi:MAG: MBL fold metallo-hydrolase [Acidobacteria bacterium]|nr:MBL fold metallo-hydrolase [Acidobacteriota bacterium]
MLKTKSVAVAIAVFVAAALLASRSDDAAAQDAQTKQPTSLTFTLKPLGHNVYAAIDDAKGDAGANAGFVIGDDGVAVVDTFENPEASKQMLAEIRKLTQLPVKFVVNTHYHIDHVAGNSLFQQNGAVVFAQRNVRSWIHTENLKFFGKEIKAEQRKMVEELGAPDAVYDTGVTLFLGSRRIDVRVFPGHTGGDSVVFIADANIVFTGDLFWRDTLPNLIDATTSAWIPTLNAVSAAAPNATYVPGHGDVGSADDVKNFRDYLTFLREQIAPAVKQNKSDDELVNAVLPAVTEKYGKWDFFKYFAKPDILHTAAEIRGDKKIPQPEK